MNTRPRRPAYHITDQAIEDFRAACRLWPRRLSCIRGVPCDSTDADVHCASCRAFYDHWAAVDREVGLQPWQMVFFDFEPPEGLDERAATRWWRHALIEAIEAALA